MELTLNRDLFDGYPRSGVGHGARHRAEQLGRIFDPFVQVDTRLTRTSDGMAEVAQAAARPAT
jgi:hypothetical protein